MFLSSRRYLTGLIFSFFFFVFSQAQTLYWVGGSGDFSDGQNWSLQSGGSPSGITPGPNSDCVFDNNFFTPNPVVSVTAAISIRSLKIQTYKQFSIAGNSGFSQISISESFEDILDNTNFQSSVNLEFNNSGLHNGNISTGNFPLSCNISVTGGKWNINKVKLGHNHTLFLNKAAITMKNSSVSAGHLNFSGCQSLLVESTIWFATKSVQISNNNSFTVINSLLNKKPLSAADLNVNQIPSSKFSNNNQTNGPCVSLSVKKPSCSPGCDGNIVLTISNFSCFSTSPTPTLISVYVDPGSCPAVNGFTTTTPGTFTLTNVCNCGNEYNIWVDEINGGFPTTWDFFQQPVVQPNIAFNANPAATASLTCNGVCTGSAGVSVFGGTAPYTFSVHPPQTSSFTAVSGGPVNQTSLCAGTLSINVRDAANCTQNFTRAIVQPAAYVSNLVTKNVVCNSACDGGFTIAPSGATPNYTVEFSTGPTFTAVPNQVFTQTGLCPGPISATVTDRNNCQYISSVNITEPSTINIAPTFSPISCGGACTGFASVSVTGGGGSYTYSWSPGGGNGPSNSSLCASSAVGIHTVTITDIPHGCVKTQTFDILEIPPLAVTADLTHIACNSFSTGAISATISGGTPNFTVTLTPSNTLASVITTTAGTVTTISNLPADTYTFAVLDAVGCTTLSVYTLTQTTALSLSAQTISNTCPGGAAGQATLTAGGGNGGYVYNWVGGNSPMASGLTNSVYPATIVDAAGCAGPTIGVSITGPPAFNFNISTTTLSCNNSSLGVISSTPALGAGPYNFSLVSGTGVVTVNNATVASFNGLAGSNGVNGVGIYTLIVADGAFPGNCPQSQTVSVQQPAAPLSTTITLSSALCFGACNGTVSGLASGGTPFGSAPAYIYNWLTPTTTINNQQTLNNQCAGAYQLTVTDANGCTSVPTTSNLNEPSQTTLAVNATSVSCAPGQGNSSNGAVTTTLTGGAGTYTYNWNGPGVASVPTQSIGNLAGGNYTLVYGSTTPGGCVESTVIPVATATAITLSTQNFSTSCATACDGTVIITATNGVTPYTYQYTGSSNSTNITGNFPNVCGNYAVLISDANSCTLTTNGTVLQPATINRTFSIQPVTCNGLSNGAYTVTPTSGVAPFSFTLAGSVTSSATGTTAIFSNLPAGNYVLSIASSATPATCSQTFAVNIPQPASITPNVTQSDATCFNVCNGSYTASPSGGTGVFSSFNWSSPQGNITGNIIAGRCASVTGVANIHTLTITDNNGCTSTSTVAAPGQPPQITLAAQNVSSVTCANGANGSIGITPAGGPSGTTYNYSWSPGGMSTATVNGLSFGAYQVTITTAINSCTTVFNFNIGQPAPIGLSATTTDVKCFGACDGSVVLTPTAGVGSFTYTLSGPSTGTSTSANFTGLCSSATPYSVTATDANGCAATRTFIIGSPVQLVTVPTNTQNSCASCSGAATLNTTGGTGSPTYTWMNAGGIVPSATTSVAGNLCPGQYTITARDNNNCLATTNLTISPVIIVVAASPSAATCFGANNGTVAIQNINGGQPNYSFLWLPSSQTTSAITNATAGIIYTIQVTDSSNPTNCVGTTTVQVTQPSSISITGSVTNVSCPGVSDGAITTTITGGPASGSTTYSWSPSGFTTQNISNINFGLHTISVTVGGCVAQQTFNVGSPDPLITASFNTVNPSNCVSPNNGSICVTPAGGDGSTYSYVWNPAVGGNTNCVTGLTAQNYSVTITSNGCAMTYTTALGSPTLPVLSLVNSQSVACNSFSTGSASFSTTGAAPVSFTWSPAASTSSTSNSITGSNLFVQSGTVTVYTVTVMDNNNCTDTETVSITQPPAMTVTTGSTNIACNSASTGVITLTASGGTTLSPGYTFSLSTGATATGTSATFPNLTAGSYSVTITDAQNCISTSTFNLIQSLPFSYTATSGDVLCNSACNGSISIITTNGTGVISYNWAAVPSATFAGSTASTITNLCPGVYSVTVTDANGCIASGPPTFTITEPSALTSTVSVQHNVTCFNDCNGSASYSVSGGTPGYTYSWTASTSTAASAGSLCVGNYVVIATDANGCTIQKSFAISGPTVPLSTTLTPTHPLCPGAFNGSITTQISGQQGAANYSWSPVGSGQNPSGLSAGGSGSLTYTLVVTDDSTCVHINTVTLADPLPITSSVAVTQSPTCFGDCDGAASLTASNAVGSTTVTWFPSGTISNSITGLCSNPFNGNPNIYTVTIVDSKGCRDTTTFALNNPAQLGVNSTVAPALCGPSNGSITISGTGGTPGYQFNWLAPLNTTGTVVTNLASGVYSVIVTDANSCSDTVAIAVSSINGPTATASSNTLLCNSVCSGSAAISAISPTNAVIQWLPPVASSVTATSLTNLCAGNYTVEINDTTNNCKTYYSFAITQPPALTTSSTMAEPTCFGICDGSLGISIAGGTPTYNLLWNGPQNFTSSAQSLTNLCGGVYSLTVTDQNNCTNTINYSLPVLNNIVIQQPVAVTNNICFGDCNATATVNVVSTTTNVLTATINWNNGQIGNTASNLCSGIYSVLVTDTRGCSNTFSVPVTSPSSISVSSSITQPSCNRCDGAAVITATGGNGPAYSYSWTTGDNTANVTDLCAGLYQVTVSDNMNCRQLHNIAVNSSSGIAGDSVLIQDELCGQPCSGAATVMAQGGAAPITYNWLNPSLPGAVMSASNLCAGTYFVQMTDANNCVRTRPVTVNPAPQPVISAFITPPVCGVSPANGSVQVLVSGITGTPSYSWSPGTSTVSSLNNIGAGNYTVSVSDGSTGCTSSQIISISNPSGPQLNIIQQNIECGGQTGSASVILTSTTPATFLWSNGATTSSVTNLPPGVITVTVTDNNGCRTLRSFTITSTAPIETDPVTQQIRCNDGCDGVITVLPLGGTLPYTFTWMPVNENTLRLDSLCAGNYSIVIADSRGCMDTTEVTLDNPLPITRTVNAVNSSCSTLADGSASVSASGGQSPYTYSWSGPNGYTAAASSISGLLTGDYTVTVTDSLGCSSPSSTLHVAPTVTIIADAGPDQTVCPRTDVVLSGTNSIGAVDYRWITPANGNTVATTINHGLNAVETETLYLETTSSLAGCTDRDTVIVNVYPLPFLDAGPSSFTIPVRSSTVIGGNPTSLSGGPSHTWSPSEYLDDTSAQNPVTNNTVNVTFTVSILFGDNCIHFDTVQVLMQPEVRIPSGFTPNSDGRNDTWIIDYIEEFPENTVEVYNRWGEQVFYSRGYFTPFDGTFRGKQLPVGTYYYVIHLNHSTYNKPYTGPLTIFR